MTTMLRVGHFNGRVLWRLPLCDSQETEKLLQREMARQADWEEQHRDAALRAIEEAVEPSTRVPFR